MNKIWPWWSSVLAFYTADPSSDPAGYLNSLKKKTKRKEKDAGVGQSLKKGIKEGGRIAHR